MNKVSILTSMNTASKLFPQPEALHMEGLLYNLVLALNHQRQSVLNRYQVAESEVEIIRYLSEHESQKMKEVGEYFNIKLSTLTSTIDKLEKNKLVKRRNSKEDRRVIFLSITPKGENLLADLQNVVREVAERYTAEANPAEFDGLYKGLEKVLAIVKAD